MSPAYPAAVATSRRHRRSCFAVTVLSIVLHLVLVAGSAGAQVKPRAERATSSLNWVRLPGSEECITARALATAVEGRLGRAVFVSASQGDLSIEGRVEPV